MDTLLHDFETMVRVDIEQNHKFSGKLPAGWTLPFAFHPSRKPQLGAESRYLNPGVQTMKTMVG